MSFVTCHMPMSRVTCICHMSLQKYIFFFDYVVKLVGEGSVISGAHLSSFYISVVLNFPSAKLSPVQVDWPACSNAICGWPAWSNAICDWPACSNAICGQNILMEGLSSTGLPRLVLPLMWYYFVCKYDRVNSVPILSLRKKPFYPLLFVAGILTWI